MCVCVLLKNKLYFFNFQGSNGNQKSDSGLNANDSDKLNEATEKVSKLKARIQELVMTMEKVTKNSEMSAQQSVEFVNDLKRTNR